MSRPFAEDHDDPLGGIGRESNDPIRPEPTGRDDPAHMIDGVSLDDFSAYMPTHSYIFTPSREMWPAASVNARISPVPLLNKKGSPYSTETANKKRRRPAHGSTKTSQSSK